MKAALFATGLLSFAVSAVTAAADVNPFLDHQFFPSPVWSDKIDLAIKTLNKAGKKDLAKKAAQVEKVSTFIWISDSASVPTISKHLWRAAAQQVLTFKKQVVQFVVYNLPDRDCSAGASGGEFSLADGGEAKYRGYIDNVVKELKQVPFVRVVIQLETDAVGNLVTNLAVPKCGDAAPAHMRSMAYAIAKLSVLPNVYVYVDGAHAAWLGWPGNLPPTAQVITDLIAQAKAINPKANVRGVTTNVSNYNGLGNQPQMGYDELIYVNNLAPLLAEKGFNAHFLVDQGRSGNQQSARSGGDWCNNKFAGFGPRPSIKTPSPLIDAIVWVKPGGEGDGSSDPTSHSYDPACASETSLKPAPAAGQWFQEYFEQLITNANPAF